MKKSVKVWIVAGVLAVVTAVGGWLALYDTDGYDKNDDTYVGSTY